MKAYHYQWAQFFYLLYRLRFNFLLNGEKMDNSSPIFQGTFENFYTYLNDFVKNKVPYLTKTYKTGICELCGKQSPLDAAHIRGQDRKFLIKKAFDETSCLIHDHIYQVDLNAFSLKINQIHSDPNNFHFLCKDCHKKYDAEGSLIKESDFHKTIIQTQFKKRSSTVIRQHKTWPFKKNKSGAVAYCTSKGIKIEGEICFASVKQSLWKGHEVYWADNHYETFLSKDWVFLLNNQHKKCFHIIRIPRGSLKPDLNKANWNKDFFDWNITTDSYVDVSSGFDLGRFGVLDVPYNDEDIKNFD